MKTRAWQTFIISAAASAAIWLITPLLTSHREPWDADGNFYLVALVIAGTVAGTIAPTVAEMLGANGPSNAQTMNAKSK